MNTKLIIKIYSKFGRLGIFIFILCKGIKDRLFRGNKMLPGWSAPKNINSLGYSEFRGHRMVEIDKITADQKKLTNNLDQHKEDIYPLV